MACVLISGCWLGVRHSGWHLLALPAHGQAEVLFPALPICLFSGLIFQSVKLSRGRNESRQSIGSQDHAGGG
ncbi:MAG: hypothetical protein Q4D19_10175, partial [Lautropia sp.]|nr:hypothetical protein [Lautropia sp.]